MNLDFQLALAIFFWSGILDQAHMRRSQSQPRPVIVEMFAPYYSDHNMITCFFPQKK